MIELQDFMLVTRTKAQSGFKSSSDRPIHHAVGFLVVFASQRAAQVTVGGAIADPAAASIKPGPVLTAGLFLFFE
jgi:hypothetical protein